MTSLRDTVKGLAGRGMAAVNPQCRFERTIFILAHMRCGSTALSNVLCSRPDVSGYGEAHVRYRSEESLGRLVVNQALRGGWKPRAAYLFDKLLHNRHDAEAPASFFRARAVFVLREPEASAISVRKLFQGSGKAEYQDDEAALGYYCDRVERLAQLWPRFPAERRIGITHVRMMADPEGALGALSQRFAFLPPLENRYASNPASRRGGGGDPTVSGTLTRIEPRATPASARPTPRLDVSPALLQRATDAYSRLYELFQK